MDGRIIKNLCLFFILTIFLTSCTQNAGNFAPVKKSADEKAFEPEVMELIQRKTDIDGVEKYGLAILCWAVEQNYVDATKMLLENGADPDIAPIKRSTETALFSTVKSLTFGNIPSERQKIYKSKIIAELLIKHGADVNHSTLIKDTPLHQAALKGRTDLCELFIQNGANVNAADTLGDTPLHRAAKEGYWEAAQILLKNGARPNLKNKLGETVLTLAIERQEEPLDRDIRKKIGIIDQMQITTGLLKFLKNMGQDSGYRKRI